MTQKELLYVEDAIEHETSIISICEETIKNLTNQAIVSFIEHEITKHNETKENLMNLLEGNNE